MFHRVLRLALCVSLAAVAHHASAQAVRITRAQALATPVPTWWKPTSITSFDIQLNDPPNSAAIPNVQVVELDIDTNPAILKAVKARGSKLVCYMNAGAWESYRNDQARFPKPVLGKAYDGYPEERWLDIRNIAALAPIMRARLDQCKKQGFVAVDPDNVNGYENRTGFPLTAAHQRTYNRWLVQEAHKRGLAIALKNTPGLAAQAAADGFDFVVSESCFVYNFCGKFAPFTKLRRPILDLEYLDEGMTLAKFCSKAKALGIQALLKRSSSSIDTYRRTCP